jgi:hypothetical protein
VDVRRPAVLTNSDDLQINVIILDISAAGFRIEVHESINVGELVTLRMDRAEDLPAKIRWVLGAEAGGEFLRSIDQSSL